MFVNVIKRYIVFVYKRKCDFRQNKNIVNLCGDKLFFFSKLNEKELRKGYIVGIFTSSMILTLTASSLLFYSLPSVKKCLYYSLFTVIILFDFCAYIQSSNTFNCT